MSKQDTSELSLEEAQARAAAVRLPAPTPEQCAAIGKLITDCYSRVAPKITREREPQPAEVVAATSANDDETETR